MGSEMCIRDREYTLHRAAFLERFAAAYGEVARDEIAPHVVTIRP